MKITIDTTDKKQVQAAETYFEALGRIAYFRFVLAENNPEVYADDTEYFTENLEYWEGVAASTLPAFGVEQ